MNWVNANNYAGSMVWTVDMDDFTGTCAGVKYPLLNIMAHHMYGRPIPAGKILLSLSGRTIGPTP